MFEKKDPISREEWYGSPEHVMLRMLSNSAAGVVYKAQENRDVLQLILAHRPDLSCYHKMELIERQLRIVSLEADNLWALCRDLDNTLSPKKFTDTNS